MDIPTVFNVSTYGETKPFNDTTSLKRVRIFYKGENRNSTYISEEFAEYLLSSLPYTPVKGIFDESGDDFKDHGKRRSEGRIYGVVPESHNFAWEDHEDESGIIRTYACADVLIYSALYPEAEKIPGKGQSMELHRPSIQGDWVTINGKRLYAYTKAAFLGLQVLGDKVEPCFEGSEFFSLYKELVKKLKGGKEGMPNFKLSDGQKAEKIFMLLNPNYNEEGGWMFDVSLIEVYDEYALVFDYEQSKYFRVSYIKNDETDTVELGEKVEVFRIDVTESEKNALEKLRSANEDTYEKVDEVFANAANKITELEGSLAEEQEKVEVVKNEYEAKLQEAQNEKATELTAKEQEFAAQLQTKESALEQLSQQLEGLKNYKLQIENQEKQNIINQFSSVLSQEVIDEFNNKLGDYTVVELKKDMALKAFEAGVFNQNSQTNDNKVPGYKINDDSQLSGAAKIIAKYKKNGGR